jgi:hypothetical protein
MGGGGVEGEFQGSGACWRELGPRPERNSSRRGRGGRGQWVRERWRERERDRQTMTVVIATTAATNVTIIIIPRSNYCTVRRGYAV